MAHTSVWGYFKLAKLSYVVLIIERVKSIVGRAKFIGGVCHRVSYPCLQVSIWFGYDLGLIRLFWWLKPNACMPLDLWFVVLGDAILIICFDSLHWCVFIMKTSICFPHVSPLYWHHRLLYGEFEFALVMISILSMWIATIWHIYHVDCITLW